MNNVSALMGQATQAFRSGDFAQAEKLSRQALKSDPRNDAIAQFLAIAQIQSGDKRGGLNRLIEILKRRPGDTALRLNCAQAALDADRPELVERICEPVSGEPAAQRLKARAAKARGNVDQAVALLAGLAESQPNDPQLLNDYANALLDSGDAEGAVVAFQRAISIDANNPQIWLNFGRARSQTSDFDGAVEAFAKASSLKPQDAEVNFELAKSFLRHGQHEAAMLRFAEAARGGKREPQVFIFIGLCFAALEQREKAEEAYRMAWQIDPASTRAILNLAVLLEQENRVTELEDLFAAARRSGLSGADIEFTEALVMSRSGDLAGALALAERVKPEFLDDVVRMQFIGRTADRLGESGKAFAAYEAMNEAMAATPEALQFDGSEHSAYLAARTAAVTPEWYARWTAREITDGRSSPAFLGGFLRSGTTLLDTILMGHPGTEVREEESMIVRLEEVGGDISSLPEASAATVAAMRDAYFAELRRTQQPKPGALVIDKYPLMTQRASFIHRAFPDAKFVFALRHPCDVVLSCWMQNFRVTRAMASFLTLENAARMYDAAMEHWQRAREVMPLDVHTIRYESMVENLEGELRPLVDFLGLEWDDSLLDHQRTAKERGYIRTPSYAQVTEKVYTRSSGRWEAYRDQMAPALPYLARWVEEFGYEPL